MSGQDIKRDLFKDVKFCIIEDGDDLSHVKTILLERGGNNQSYLSDMVTHVIADNPESPGVSEAQELFEKPVVTSRWVTLSAKCNTLLPLNGFSPSRNQLFSGAVICPSRISTKDSKFLWAMVTYYGGILQVELNQICTHLVAGKADGAKYEYALRKPDKVKIVTPDWILDSVKNKKQCDEDLYHPRLLILPEAEIPKPLPLAPSPLSTPVTSNLISLTKMSITESAGQSTIQLPPQFAPRTIKIPNIDSRAIQDAMKAISNTVTVKTDANLHALSTQEASGPPPKTPSFPSLPQQQLQQAIRQLTSPISQHQLQQSQQHQQMLQQGEQKLNQALQHLRAQQQQQQQTQLPQLQRGQQVPTPPQQMLQQKIQWQQRMSFAQQQQVQQQLIQMQRFRIMQQQQQQLRSRQPVPASQLALLQQQQPSTQPHLTQQATAQQHVQQQTPQSPVQQKQSQVHIQQLQLQPQHAVVQQQPTQQTVITQQHLQQSRPPSVQTQSNLQTQTQIHSQQPSLPSQLQQQTLQKQQLQQQIQQQLLKQQHIQHLQQQQAQLQHLQQPQSQQVHLQQSQPQQVHLQQSQSQQVHLQQQGQHLQPVAAQQQQQVHLQQKQQQVHLQQQQQVHLQQQQQQVHLQQQSHLQQQTHIQQTHIQQTHIQQQSHLQQQVHLQQQQALVQQQPSLTQSPHLQPPIQQSSPHHLQQQQALLQPSPRQSPLQQSPMQQSPLQQSPLQQSPLQHSPMQQSPQQPTPIQQTLQTTQLQQTSQLPQQSQIQQAPQLQQQTPQLQQQTPQLQQQTQIQQTGLQTQPVIQPAQQALLSQQSPQQHSPLQQTQLLQQNHALLKHSPQPHAQQASPHLQQQLQRQPSPQPPPSPHLQQQRFVHQLHQSPRGVQKQFQQVTFSSTQQPMLGQPPVQGLQQQQLVQQNQLRQQQQLQQQLALQQLRQRQLQQQQQQQQQQLQNNQQQTSQQVLSGQPPVMMKPPPQYPYDRQQLTGQPRLQYPPHPRQISVQSPQQGPRLPWPQFSQQQQQVIQRPPGTPQPQSPQWQQLQQPSPKDELSPSPQSLQQQQVLWQQRQDQQREASTPAPQPAITQQIAWQTQSPQPQQQQASQPRENPQPLQQSQLLQWQQIKQLELRRQQLLQQQQLQQQQLTAPRQTPLIQFSQQAELSQNASRVAVASQSQPALAVPAQYQPQSSPSASASQQTPPPNLSQVVQPTTQVTPKTKTALANLLNTRLQGTGRAMEVECNQPVVRNAQASPEDACTPFQQPIQASPRKPSSETTPLIQSAVSHTATPERTVIAQVPQVHFYGHDPRIQVPPDLSLLGCIFCIQDYDKSVEEEKLNMWKKIINQHGGEVEANYGNCCTHVLCESQRNSIVQQAMREGKRCVTAYWLNDVLQQKKMKPPWLALHLPSPFLDDKPCKSQIITITNFEGEERKRLKLMIQLVGAKYTGYMTQHNSMIICKRKDGSKALKAREWKIPVVNVQWLHDVMFGHYEALRLPMAHKYQLYDLEDHFKIDYALVPHLMAAWKVPVKITEEMWKKFLPLSASNANKDQKKRKTDESGDELNSKRQRSESPVIDENIPLTTQNPPADNCKPRVMFTGMQRISIYCKIVYQLGGCLTKSTKECTHLIASSMARTVKFLCTIHTVKYIVTPEWLVECEKQNGFVDEQPYILQDSEGEKNFGCCLKETLTRSDWSPIFKGYVFFITPGVFPPPSVLKDVVEHGAGVAVFKKRPTHRQIASMTQAGTKFVVITCSNDLHLCKDFLQKKISVQSAEFLLTGSMRQYLDFESFAFT